MATGLHREPRDRRNASSRKLFSWLRSRTSYKSGTKEAQFLYSLPERPKLRGLQAKQDYKGSLQKANCDSVPRAEKCGDLITADLKVLNEGCESRHNHRYSVVVQDFSHSMDSVLPVQNKNFSGDGNKFTKVSRAVWKAKSHWNWQCVGILANPVKTYHGIIVLRHPIDPRRMAELKEQCAE